MQAHAIFWEKTQIIFANSYLLSNLAWPLLEPKVFIVLCRLLKSFVFKVIRFFQNYTLSSTSLRRVKRNCFQFQIGNVVIFQKKLCKTCKLFAQKKKHYFAFLLTFGLLTNEYVRGQVSQVFSCMNYEVTFQSRYLFGTYIKLFFHHLMDQHVAIDFQPTAQARSMHQNVFFHAQILWVQKN